LNPQLENVEMTNLPDQKADDALVCSVGEAKRKLRGYSHQRLYDLINDGTLKSYREGRRRFILVASIHNHINQRLQEAS